MGIIRGWNRALKVIILWFVQKNNVKAYERKCLAVNISSRKMFGRSHRKPFKECVNRELNFIDKVRCKFFSPELNAVYLIRKMQYLQSSRMGGV